MGCLGGEDTDGGIEEGMDEGMVRKRGRVLAICPVVRAPAGRGEKVAPWLTKHTHIHTRSRPRSHTHTTHTHTPGGCTLVTKTHTGTHANTHRFAHTGYVGRDTRANTFLRTLECMQLCCMVENSCTRYPINVFLSKFKAHDWIISQSCFLIMK